jgi:hypothetical protein
VLGGAPAGPRLACDDRRERPRLEALLGPRTLRFEELAADAGHRPVIRRDVLAGEALAVLEASLR